MDRRQERAALQRIVALLLALAELADRARESSPAVPALVLWFLRPAELVARDFVGGAALPAGPASPAEALAQNFRALARALQRQARSAGGALRAFAVTLAQNLAPMREEPAFASARENPAPHDTS